MKIWIKNLALLMLISATANVCAMGNGFYLGLMAGPGTNNAPPLPAQVNPTLLSDAQAYICPLGNQTPNQLCTTLANPRHNQFASRIFIGNQFNPYASIEGGVT